MYEQLFQRHRRKGFLQRIVIDDEKCVHYSNPKRRKSLGAVYQELRKRNDTITGDCWRKYNHYMRRYTTDKELLELDNNLSHVCTTGVNLRENV